MVAYQDTSYLLKMQEQKSETSFINNSIILVVWMSMSINFYLLTFLLAHWPSVFHHSSNKSYNIYANENTQKRSSQLLLWLQKPKTMLYGCDINRLLLLGEICSIITTSGTELHDSWYIIHFYTNQHIQMHNHNGKVLVYKNINDQCDTT